MLWATTMTSVPLICPLTVLEEHTVTSLDFVNHLASPANDSWWAAVLPVWNERRPVPRVKTTSPSLPSIALLSTEHTGSLCIGSSWFPTGLLQGSEYASKLNASWGKTIFITSQQLYSTSENKDCFLHPFWFRITKVIVSVLHQYRSIKRNCNQTSSILSEQWFSQQKDRSERYFNNHWGKRKQAENCMQSVFGRGILFQSSPKSR